ncbi:L-aspartate oxidase [filamentous cyanobacterium CCP5]|nr:L-aspartate oxidase [filamentous cyanobacterium CCP5]
MSVSSVDYDVIVVGGGAAGLYTALCLPTYLRVALITKDTLSLSASDWAQGGIAAAIGPNDAVSFHVEDTLRAGAGLCEPAAVLHLAEQAKNCIHHLLDLGVAFDRHGEQLAMTLEAAHSRHRVLHAADTTGRAVVSILAERVLRCDHISVLEQAFVLNLWHGQNFCRGVVLSHQQEIRWLSAQLTVLATGGGGQIYAYTTNPEGSTGDGVAMAWRSGVELRDLEFFQFHPTSLNHPEAPPFLISEAVRGEGAHLVDDSGHRFAFTYHPDGELAPRDVVSRAIFQHMALTGQSRVWLDMRPIDAERLHYRFPNIVKVCRYWGIDPAAQPVPVSPAAHYWMGGITTDLHSRTSLTNLYAVGENASTGVHGANRLASNSLLECLVYGAELGQLEMRSLPPSSRQPALSLADLSTALSGDLPDWSGWRSQLSQLLWQSAGICRDQATLEAAIDQINDLRQRWQLLPLTQAIAQLPPGKVIALPENSAAVIRQWGELQNLHDIGWLILTSAHFRTESRGGHYRSDYPQTIPAWRVHTSVIGNQIYRSDLEEPAPK